MQQVHNENALIRWCKENNYKLPYGEGFSKIKETHLLLNGGRILIPDDAHEKFMQKVNEAIMREQAWLYIVERKTNPGRFFLELDLVIWDRRLTKDDIVNVLMPPFSRVMRSAFAEQDIMSVICTAPTSVVTEDKMQDDTPKDPTRENEQKQQQQYQGKERVKNGIHIIWPNIIVDQDTAWTLRAWLLFEITSHLEELAPLGVLCEPWEKVIDPCVFGANGLRMLWSRKADTCKVCKGVPFQKWITEKRMRIKAARGPIPSETVKRPDIIPCKVCNTFDNKVDMGRPYDILAVVDCDNPDELMSRFASDTLLALKMTSIRVVPAPDKTSEFQLPTHLEKSIEPWRKKGLKEINQLRKRGPTEIHSGKRNRSDADGMRTSLVTIESDDKAYQLLSYYVTSVMKCGVMGIKSDEFKHFFLVNTTSHECRNKGGVHNRSTVYYIFMPDGYYQKCWCRKGDVYRPGGVSCENYRSQLIPYTTGDIGEIRQLFSARFAKQFPFAATKSQTQSIDEMLQRASTPSVSSLDDTSNNNGSQDSSSSVTPGGLLVDSYPELRGRSFSEARKIIEERMKAWRNINQTNGGGTPSK